MKAKKCYQCIKCGAEINPGDIYDRLWVSSDEFFPHCKNCMPDMYRPRDFLMWIGNQHYPTVEDFIDEAVLHGVNKRVPTMSWGISRGSRGFLIHDNGEEGAGQIFACFVVQGIRWVVSPDASKEFRQSLVEQGYEPVAIGSPKDVERGCGHMVAGAAYYYSQHAMNEMAELAKRLGAAAELEGGIITFANKIPYPGKRFRGVKYLEPGMVPSLDNLGIKIYPWRQWQDRIRVEGE